MPEIQLGNTAVDLESLVQLCRFGRVYGDPNEQDTIYLEVSEQTVTHQDLIALAVLVRALCPDEVSAEGRILRFWWD